MESLFIHLNFIKLTIMTGFVVQGPKYPASLLWKPHTNALTLQMRRLNQTELMLSIWTDTDPEEDVIHSLSYHRCIFNPQPHPLFLTVHGQDKSLCGDSGKHCFYTQWTLSLCTVCHSTTHTHNTSPSTRLCCQTDAVSGVFLSPCSRSRWSYHGSSSSVTNSSIPPARSISVSRWTPEAQRCADLSKR